MTRLRLPLSSARSFARSNVVGLLALVVACSGTAFAATQLPDDSVDSDTIVFHGVGSDDLAGRSVGSGKIRTDAVRGRAVKESSLDPDVLQRRVGGQCKPGESIRAIGSDGSVLCQLDTTGATGAAGGDLTGTYPDPDLAAGAVGAPEVADGSLTGDDIGNGTIFGIDIAPDTLTGAQVDEGGLAAGGDLSGTLANAQVNEGGLAAGGDLSGTLANAQVKPGTVGATELSALPAARALATTTQSFPATVITRVQLNSNSYSQGVAFDDANDQFVVQQAGIYAISAEILWKSNSAGIRFLGIYQDGVELVTDTRNATTNYATLENVVTVQKLSPGQVVYAVAGSDVANNTDVGEADSTSPRGASLTLSYLGPAASAPRPAGATDRPGGRPGL